MNRLSKLLLVAAFITALVINPIASGLSSVQAAQKPTGTPGNQRGGKSGEHLRKGPPALPKIPSKKLEHIQIPERSASLKPVGANEFGQLINVSYMYAPVAQVTEVPTATATQQACTSPTIDLKILIIVTDPTDTNTALPAIKQALDYQGTTYTAFTASPRPSDPAADRLASLLSNGCHGNFEGVILGNGEVAYSDPSAGWESALTNTEWQSLYTYERTFSVRQATWYTFPSSQYGFNPPSSSGDTTSAPITASYTGAAAPVFGLYANTANPLTIRNVC